MVVEGESQEPRLFRKIFKEYELDMEYEIYTYGTTIHELYERMFAEGYEGACDLSLLSVLKEREVDEEKRKLLDGNFSDILLVFDYDPQDNRFSSHRLEEMSRYFDESTDEGKLYLNYPMLEACKHFRTMPDLDYLTREVEIEDVACYKKTVGYESRCQSYERDFNKAHLDRVIVLTMAKAVDLCGFRFVPSVCWKSYEGVDLVEVLRRQNQRLEQKTPLAVIATCLLFVCDYSFDLVDHEAATTFLWPSSEGMVGEVL